MTDDGRDQNEDPFPLDEDAFQEFIDGPRDVFVCDSCGSKAYRGHRSGEPGAFYAEVDAEPAIVCHDCDDTYDWETVESRIRASRGMGQRSLIRGWIDQVRAVGAYIVRWVELIRGGWHRGVPWSPTESSDRRGSSQSEKPVEQPNESQTEGTRHEEGQGPNDDADELEQTRKWATYLESELHDREEQLQDLEAELAQVQQEIEEARRAGQSEVPPTGEREDLLTDLFDIRDNFQRVLDAGSVLGDEAGADFIEGIELIDSQIRSILEREGVEEIDTSGEVDPTKHRVVKTVPAADADPGEIVDAFQLGYRQDDRVLREAQVVVAEEPPADDGAGTNDGGSRINRGDDAA